MPNLVVIEYTQSIAYEQDGVPQEHLSVSVRFTYEAFSSGWVKEHFGGRGGPTDFLVMTAIAHHARPLRGEDLRLLVRLGAAGDADEGRLYARVTDLGLADELGCGRDTVKNAAQRLAEKGLIRICDLPDDFRDSKGQFSGARAYIISGIPSTYVAKAIAQGNGGVSHRAGSSSTDGHAEMHRAGLSGTGEDAGTHRAGLASTVGRPGERRAGLAVTVDPAHRAGSSGTNKEEDEKEEEEDVISSLLDRFASHKGDPAYRPGRREHEQVRKLLDEGYAAHQIARAIDQVFDVRPPDANPVRSFGFVVSYVHRRLQPIGRPPTEVDLAGDTVGRKPSAPAGDRPTGTAAPGAPPTADAARTPRPADDPLAPVYALLEAASIRGLERVEDAVYDVPGIRLGLRHLQGLPEPFAPEEIRGAVLAAVSRSVPPERLVGYVRAVLENARREVRERERRQRPPAATRPAGPDDVAPASGGYPAAAQEAEPSPMPDGPDREARAKWQAALGELAMQMTRATFDTWVRPANLLAWESEGDDDGQARTRVVLGTPNGYVKDWLQHRLYTPIQRTLSGVAGHPVEVAFEVCDQATGPDRPVWHAP